VDLLGGPEEGMHAHVIVKQAFTISGGVCRAFAAEPLFHDLRDPKIRPQLRAGSDYWRFKGATDFVVQGEAHAPGGRPVARMEVAVKVGGVSKWLAVFGRRPIRWGPGGKVAIEAPEPFLTMPLTYANAYGGIDWRVRAEVAPSPAANLNTFGDHPGMYPRNPFGKGYLIEQGEVPGMEMPNLEDPADLLTAERLIVRDGRQWYGQPLPWCFDWVHPVTFPRCVFFSGGVDAWFPGPEDGKLPEVRRGFLPAGFRSSVAGRGLVEGPEERFYQEASCGLVLRDLRGGERVELKGMHPNEPVVSFPLPMPPILEIEVEGKREAVPPRLHSVICRPAEKKVFLVWAGDRALPRPFVPGVHKHIPVAASLNHDEPVYYQAPPTVRDLVAASQKGK
jgi:hypothetical protein